MARRFATRIGAYSLGKLLPVYRGHLGPPGPPRQFIWKESVEMRFPDPKSRKQSRKRVKIVEKQSILTLFRLVFRLFEAPGPERPWQNSFSHSFSEGFGPELAEGPNDHLHVNQSKKFLVMRLFSPGKFASFCVRMRFAETTADGNVLRTASRVIIGTFKPCDSQFLLRCFRRKRQFQTKIRMRTQRAGIRTEVIRADQSELLGAVAQWL